jgi:hypothetical protein
MGGSCNTNGEEESLHTGFWWGNLRERENLDSLSLDGKEIL